MCQCQKSSSCCGGSCGCASKGCSCGSNKSCGCGGNCGSGSNCGHQKEGCCDHAAKFLELADCAWMEVLKEKIKEQIRANSKNIDELAKIISDANQEKWKKKMEAKDCCGNYEEKLSNFFGQSSCYTKK